MNDQEQMKLSMVKDLSLLLMEDDPSMSMDKALSIVLNSDTYQRLQNEATRLYYQSPRYVYSFLENELKTGLVS